MAQEIKAIPPSRVFTKSEYLALFCIIAVTVFLCIPSNTDYLFYFLPLSDYLYQFGHFPTNLSLSPYDFVFAYPPAESFVLYPIHWFPHVQGLAVKLIIVMKVLACLYLFYRCGTLAKNRRIINLMLIQPGLVIYLFLYNQDLSTLMAMMAVILYDNDSRYGLLVVLVLAYALLSKYIFFPLYVFILVYFFIKKRERFPFLLLPLLPFCLFLYKNYALYQNPFFPMLDRFFNTTDSAEWELLVKNNLITLAVQSYDFDQVRNIFVQYGIGMIFAAVLLPWRKNKTLVFLVVTYLVFYATVPDTTQGHNARYLFPITMLILFLLAQEAVNESSVMIVVLVSYFLSWKFLGDVQVRTIILSASAYPLLCLIPKTRSYAMAAILCLFISYAVARTYYKFNIDPKEVGYSAHREEIATLESIINGGSKVLTDFSVLPLRLRMHENLVLCCSRLTGDKIRDIMLQHKDGGIQYLLLMGRDLPMFDWFLKDNRYEFVREVGDTRSFSPRPLYLYRKTSLPMPSPITM